ncbi:MAG: 50S ribosomal protein L11 methyltransferase [Acidimicrobiia bacterium]
MDNETVTWKGRLGPFDLKLAPGTFRPSTISTMVADMMQVKKDDVVIDMGCGTGVLSIIAAKLGAKMVHGVDAESETIEVATSNAEAQGVSETTRFYHGDMFAPLPEDVEADVVIGDVSGIPDDFARESGWFPSGLSGGPSGSELPVRMLEEARRFLTKGGKLFLPTGTLQDENSILDAARSLFGKLKKLSEKRIPLPSSLSENPAIIRMAQEKVINVTQRGSRMLWTARVWEVSI